jgi:hypothetical protein
MPMEMYIKDIGKMIKLMERVNKNINIEKNLIFIFFEMDKKILYYN